MPEAPEARLGLSLGVAPPGSLLTLVLEIGRRVRVADAGDVDPSDPVLVRVEWHRAPRRRTRGRVAWWVDDAGLQPGGEALPDLILSADPQVVAGAGAAGLLARLVPAAEVEPESTPVAPFVRERVRAARGLGPGVVEQDADGRLRWDGGETLADAAVASALAAASVAYLTEPGMVVRALAWGCPVVTTEAACRQTGATPGTEVVLDDGAGRSAQLSWVREDPRLSARLSTAARRRYEHAHSVTACADEVMSVLGLASRWGPSRMEARLLELDSRRGDLQRRRFDEMVSLIVDEGL